jgi:uncharacterized membrane protein
VAQGLGWLSIGLGLTEIVADRWLARLLGMNRHPVTMRLLGLREVASGIGILAGRRPQRWLWSRTAGDALDLALLATAVTAPRVRRGGIAVAMLAVAGIAALDWRMSRKMSRMRDPQRAVRGGVRGRQSIIVDAPAEELYQFWRRLENLPRFMKNLQSVETTGDKTSRWTALGPGGATTTWDAEIVNDQPGSLIAWRSIAGAAVSNRGRVQFERAPGGRGTVVRVEMEYAPPAGRVGAALAGLLGSEPEQLVREDLRRFKRIIETGELLTTEGQPSARASSTSARYDQAVRGTPRATLSSAKTDSQKEKLP